MPQDGDSVVIPNNSTVTLDKDSEKIASLTVAAGGTLLGDADKNKLKLDAPGNLTNNGTITLNTAEIDMKGNLVNTGIFNAGSDTLKLDGNFSNTGTFNAQTGEVEFDGNAVQTITGNVTFNYLKVDNGSNNGLLLQGNVIVNGALSGNAVSGGLVTLADTCPDDYTLTSNNGNTVQHSCPPPIAEYRFDEISTGPVADSSGNNLSGTLNGGVTVGGSGKICNGYRFNGSSGYVSVPNNALLNLSKVTVATWVRHSTASIKNWEAIVTKGDSAYRMHLNGGCSINNVNKRGGLSFGVNTGCKTADINSGTVPVAGTWYHVVGTYDGSTINIYVNGTISALRSYSGALNSNTFPLYIGANAQQSGRFFSGDIDEVKIYNSALTADQISAGYANENAGKNWDGSARVCAVTGPHHIEIQHPTGSGLTCAASTLTIRACADAACNTLYTGGVSGTLTASGTPTVNWDGSTGEASGAGFVISAGSSSVDKSVQVATEGSVVFDITATSPAPTNAATCNFGTPTCTFIANTAGFVFSDTSTGMAYNLPPQVSGIASAGLYLRALQSSSANPAVCTPAIISQNTPVTLGYACNNPASCQPGNLATVNATSIAPVGTAVNLTFDADGSAPITLRYDDVGQITFNASKTVTPFGGSTPVTLKGSSNAVVVAPHHFGFSGITTGQIKAGNAFAATVTAYNGFGTATGNFGKETAAEGVTLTHTKIQPTGTSASSGIFSGAVGTFNNGKATAGNLNWSEVGTIDLTATLASGSYLASGLTATGNTGAAGAVGPFTPDHFITTVADGCTGCGFTYSGQPFAVTVTAMNGLAAPTKTLNYDGSLNTTPNFAQDVTLTAWDAATGATQDPGGSLLPAVKTAVPLSAFERGEAMLDEDASKPFFTFSTVPTAPATIRIRAAETTVTPAVSSLGFTEGSTEIRSGQIRLINNYGSELLNLPIQLVAQYWASTTTNWVNSATDNTTSFVVASPPATSAVSFSNFQKNLTAVAVAGSPVTITLASGRGGFTLSAPGTGHSGSVDLVIPALTGAGCETSPVLLGCYLPSAPARATFGIYKSSLIYRRENY